MQGKEGGHDYENTTWWDALVADYTGLNFRELLQLDHVTYLQWRRDAFIAKLESTEAGQEYLDNAWRMEQTTPDRIRLRKKLGKDEGNG